MQGLWGELVIGEWMQPCASRVKRDKTLVVRESTAEVKRTAQSVNPAPCTSRVCALETEKTPHEQ